MKWLVALLLTLSLFYAHEEGAVLQTLSAEERAFLEAHPVIRIGNDIDWPPVDYVDESGRHQGMVADYMALLSQRLGVEFKPVVDKPWHKVRALAKAREIDIFACAVKTPEREAYMRFSTPYLYFPVVIVTDDRVSYLRDINDLSGHTIGVAAGYATHEILTTRYPHLELVVFESSEEGLKAVSQGQVFAFIGTLATMGYTIRQAGLTNLKISGEFPHHFELAVGVRDDWPLLHSAIEKALESITPEEHDAIYHRWIHLTYEQKPDLRLVWQVALAATLLLAAVLLYNRTLAREIRARKAAEARAAKANEALTQKVAIELERSRRQEQMLIQQSKMAAMGEMIAAIAHQWKQPLTVLSLISQDILQMQKSGDLDEKALLEGIEQAHAQIAFMSQTIDDFRNFLRPSKEARRFDVRREVEELLRLFGLPLRKAQIRLELHAPDRELIATGYPNELKQVLLNLINNAKDAIEEQKRRDAEFEGAIALRIDANDGEICICVEDNGGGVKDTEALFEPYHTSKGPNGTGLGLYLSRTIVEESMGGRLTLINKAQGACFRVCLPQGPF